MSQGHSCSEPHTERKRDLVRDSDGVHAAFAGFPICEVRIIICIKVKIPADGWCDKCEP